MAEARPRRWISNHAAIRLMEGTSTSPLPMPVSRRAADAPARVSDKPVKSIPAAVTTMPIVITLRGPHREASTPPTADMTV